MAATENVSSIGGGVKLWTTNASPDPKGKWRAGNIWPHGATDLTTKDPGGSGLAAQFYSEP